MNEKTVKKHQSRTSAEQRVQLRDEDGNKFLLFPFLAELTLVTLRTKSSESRGPRSRLIQSCQGPGSARTTVLIPG